MSWIKDFIILTLLIGTLFGATLGNYPLSAPDAARYAEIPREMVVTGDYITPHLNYIKYFEKPPLFYWMQSAAIKTFGVNEFAVDFSNALLGLLSCLLVYFAGRSLFGRLSGLFASMVLATSTLFFAMTQLTTLDLALTFFLSAGLLCFILANQKPLGMVRDSLLMLMYVLFALAVMTKGLIGIVFPLLIIFAYVLIFNEWRNLKTYRIVSGLILFLLIALPWHILVQLRNPEFWHFYFVEQHFLRYLTPYAGREQPWWFFIAVAAGGFFPWILYLPQSLVNSCPKHWQEIKQAKPTLFLLLWIIIVLVFYTFSNSKLIPYILPIFPPLALIVGKYLGSIWNTPKQTALTPGFYLICILSLAIGVVALGAIVTLNFKTLLITRDSLAITGMLLILASIVAIIVYLHNMITKGLVVYTIIFALALASTCPMLPIANNHSIKPLALTIKQKIQPNDEVMSYATYYQDLPFYLGRRVTVVNYKGELEFGTAHQDTSDWMIDEKTFWQRWQGKKKIYMVLSKSNYEALNKSLPNKLTVLSEGLRDVVVSN